MKTEGVHKIQCGNTCTFIVYPTERQVQVFQTARIHISTHQHLTVFTWAFMLYLVYTCCTIPYHSRCRNPSKVQSCEPIQATPSMHGRVRVSTEADDGNFEHWLYIRNIHPRTYSFAHYYHYYYLTDRLCGLVVRVSGYRYRGLGFDSRRYQIFWVAVGLERGTLSLVSLVRSIEELLE